MAARKLCLQSLSHFLQSSLYFFLPHASRKNAHSLLRYLGIRGMAATSFPFVFFEKHGNSQGHFLLYAFGAILDVSAGQKRISL